MAKCAGVALWLAAFAAACSGTDSALGPECVEGMTISCTCDDGAPGVKTCGPNGAFGSCECTLSGGLSADQNASGSSASATGDGAVAGGGAQDGSAGAPAPEPATGDGDADANPDPSAPGDGDGDGDANPDPNPPADGDANPDPNVPGDGDADPGTGGDGDGDGETRPPAKPAGKGELYGPCGDAGDCRDGNLCVKGDPLQTEQPAIGYCAPRCDSFGTGGGNGAGNPRPCPQPASGDVAASCNVLSSQCTLASCADAECPAGMSCVERTVARPPGILVTILECAYER